MKYLLALLATSLSCLGANVTLTWDPPERGIPNTYTVYALASGQSWTVSGVTNTSVTLSNLVAGVRHSFFVVAVADAGTSPQSNIVSITPSEIIDVDIPAMESPSGLIYSGILLGNDLHWTLGIKWTHANTNAIGYRVLTKASDGSIVYDIKTTAKNAQIPKLPFGSTNTITVSAYDRLGNESQPSDPLTATVSLTPLGLGAVQYNSVFQLPGVKPQ